MTNSLLFIEFKKEYHLVKKMKKRNDPKEFEEKNMALKNLGPCSRMNLYILRKKLKVQPIQPQLF